MVKRRRRVKLAKPEEWKLFLRFFISSLTLPSFFVCRFGFFCSGGDSLKIERSLRTHERRKAHNRTYPFKCGSLLWTMSLVVCSISPEKRSTRKERKANKNVLLIINARRGFFSSLWPSNWRRFLNRQIYCCIQFAIYGILRSSHQPKMPRATRSCIKSHQNYV